MHRRFALLVVVLLVGGAGIRSTITTLAWGAQQPASPEAIVPDRVIQLFNGRDLSGWQPCPPETRLPTRPTASSFVRNGMLVSLGTPRGHLLTESAYRDYRLEVEYRFPGKPGNCASWCTRRGCARCRRCFLNRSRSR